ncbi:Telomerase activating protein Est1 [Nesidiocoris tenuis]|uniref:Telomerase activating protein Est1 n=1 Tax=Nesidiocoris tenuis TaxID=355587 RepID=A0ABN7A9F0_9HEMI|nr:Telomerase activating protein Est1 [Nesidiocoris tenuis]
MHRSKSDSADLPVKLFRTISEAVKHLEGLRGRNETIADLFSDSAESLRMKIREYGDKLMFMEPVSYGKKVEDIIWRKVFHGTVATAKKLSKNQKMEAKDRFMICTYLQSGLGFYYYIVMKLQSQFHLNLGGVVDFNIVVVDCGLDNGKNSSSLKCVDASALDWANDALSRCLICLGDISRYLSDFDPSYDHNHALRYYIQALTWKPDGGMPHNQLGAIASNNEHFSTLDSAYHYMRCIFSKEKFDGAEENLQILMDNNACVFRDLARSGNVLPDFQKLIATFIQLVGSFMFSKSTGSTNQMCLEVLTELESCSAEAESKNNRSIVAPPNADQELTDDVLFKMLIMSIMCVQKLQAENSPQLVTATAFNLSIISQLLQICNSRIEKAIPVRKMPASFQKFVLDPRRRRRRERGRISSDLSDDDNDSTCSLDSNNSEEELIFDQYVDSDEDHCANTKLTDDTGLNGFKNKIDFDPNMPWDYPVIARDRKFQFFMKLNTGGCIFQSLKVAFSWMESNNQVLQSFSPSHTPFFDRMLNFLNHLSSLPSHAYLKEHFDEEIIDEDDICSIPLPEDVTVRGLSSLDSSHAHFNWERLRTRHLKPTEETYCRLVGILKIGRTMCSKPSSQICYDDSKQWFALSNVSAPVAGGDVVKQQAVLTSRDSKGNSSSKREADPAQVEKLMHNMGELWLKSEVSVLEDKARKRVVEDMLPPYVVPDAEAFLNYSSQLKQIISVKKFVVLIPSVVISTLDEYKTGNNKVRDTIRWLEWQLRNGRRNIRLQRPTEHQPLPYIKYPKKKDKEAWIFLQVMECCNYLCNQSTGVKNPELVTLVTGSAAFSPSNTENTSGNGFSVFGVAKSAGINVEHVDTFFNKWKNAIKSHG